ncbi:MAG: ribosomal protein S18-alanine N-acetyltransferase [Halobacteriaceae archaeon]
MTATHSPDADPSVTVRRAVRADLLAVVRIERAAFDQPWPFSAFQRFVGERGFLVADADGAGGDVVGYVVAGRAPDHGPDVGHVKNIAVRADRRGEGIGSALLSHALYALARSGATAVKLEVRPSNDVAIDLYRDFGFEYRRTVPRYYDDGEDAYVMVRDP